jgi:hypothetical protein
MNGNNNGFQLLPCLVHPGTLDLHSSLRYSMYVVLSLLNCHDMAACFTYLGDSYLLLLLLAVVLLGIFGARFLSLIDVTASALARLPCLCFLPCVLFGDFKAD